MYGYAGKLVRVDLTTGKIIVEQLKEETISKFIGGKGLSAKILFEETKPKMAPLSSESPLIFSVGPITGVPLSGNSRFCAVFKSPLTGIWGESQCGGHFPAHMKWAGYDALIIKGVSKSPSFIVIEDDNFEIKDASHLWGKDTFETQDIIKKDYGKRFQVLSIGPAGENLVKYACISHDKGREFGRCGVGAIMGSKKLKAIAILGSKKVEIANTEKFDQFKSEINNKIKETHKSLTNYGTPSIMAFTNTTGTLPTRYWQQGEFDGFEEINAETMKEKIVKRKKACYSCAVACRKMSEIKSGPYAGTEVEGPEYETSFAFGALCGNNNLESIAKANEICDRLGIDTITAGNSIAFAMMCYENKIITDKNTDGLSLTFGNQEAILVMLRNIAYRNGFGNLLAEGVRMAAEGIGKGAAKLAMHVKGLEPPGYDPRGLKGVALAFAVSCRGACHLRHLTYRPNLMGSHPFGEDKEIDRFSYEGQAKMVKEQEDFYALVDSMVLCKFLCLPTIGPILWDELLELYSIVTGIRTEKIELIRIAERINNLVRSFNMREGIERNDDTLPVRFMREGLKKGASEGEVVQKEEFDKMSDEYYQIKRWS